MTIIRPSAGPKCPPSNASVYSPGSWRGSGPRPGRGVITYVPPAPVVCVPTGTMPEEQAPPVRDGKAVADHVSAISGPLAPARR